MHAFGRPPRAALALLASLTSVRVGIVSRSVGILVIVGSVGIGVVVGASRCGRVATRAVVIARLIVAVLTSGCGGAALRRVVAVAAALAHGGGGEEERGGEVENCARVRENKTYIMVREFAIRCTLNPPLATEC